MLECILVYLKYDIKFIVLAFSFLIMQLIKFFIWIFIDNSLIKYFLSFIIYLIIIQSLFLLLALIFFDLKFNFSTIIAKIKITLRMEKNPQ